MEADHIEVHAKYANCSAVPKSQNSIKLYTDVQLTKVHC